MRKVFFLLGIILVFFIASCCVESCENPKKHSYSIGTIVKHKLDHGHTYIIKDTTRNGGCEPQYYVEDKDGYTDYLDESFVTQ